MLRAGPWGDGFDGAAAGLSLAKVRAVPHAVDLGEIESCFPQVEVTDDMMPGVVCLPHGFGHDEDDVRLDVARARQAGVNANALTDDQPLDVPSGTSIANGVPVEVLAA